MEPSRWAMVKCLSVQIEVLCNMAYQGYFKETGVVEKLFDVSGDELIGLPLKAPQAMYACWSDD